MEQKPLLTDPREDSWTNLYFWQGYDAREQGKPYAILTTCQYWRAGWTLRDSEIEKGIAWRAPEIS